jgi:hypothetical protein
MSRTAYFNIMIFKEKYQAFRIRCIMLILKILNYVHFSFVYKERLKEMKSPKLKKDGGMDFY